MPRAQMPLPPGSPDGAAASDGEADSIFGTPAGSEKSLHEIILDYLSDDEKPKK